MSTLLRGPAAVVAWLLTRALMLATLISVGSEQGVWSDVLVYASWAQDTLDGHHAVLREYPPLARLLLMLPGAAGDEVTYAAIFLSAMAAADALLLLRLRRMARASRRPEGVLLWILAPAALGSLSWARFDMVAVALAAAAMMATTRRRGIGLSVVATLVKAWPVVLVPTLEGRARDRLRTGAVTVALAVLGLVVLAWVPGGTPFSWLTWASHRGVQIESLPGLVLALSSLAGSSARVSYNFGSWQIAVPGASDMVVERALLVAGVLIVAALLLACLRRTADKRQADILSTLAIAVVLLSSKVFSPQYLLWLIGPAAVLLTVHRLRRPGLLGGLLVLCAASTHAVYPLLYVDLLALHVVPVVVLLVRTVLLVAVAAVLAAEVRQAVVVGDGHDDGAEAGADLQSATSR